MILICVNLCNLWLRTYGIKRTLLLAFQTPDTISGIGLDINGLLRGTDLAAELALGAFILIHGHFINTQPVKQGKQRAQRTKSPAE